MSGFRILFLSLLLLLLIPHSKEEPKEDPKEETEEEVEEVEQEEDGVSPGNCSACAEESRARRELRLRGIRAQILGSLGLREPPNVSRAQLPRVPPLDHLLLDYANHQRDEALPFAPGPEYADEDDDEDFYVSAKKVLAFPHTPPPSVPTLESGDRHLYFRFSSNLHGQHVHSAHLWIHLPRHHHKGQHHHNLTLYQVERQDLDLVQLKRKSVERKGAGTKGHWMVFDVKKSVAQWIKHPKENLGFVLRSSHEQSDSDHAPFVEVKVERGRSRGRHRRMIGLNCEEDADEVRCCRYPLTVDFEEFGWDWIIAPKRYEANYCSGECPYVFLQKYPHTHLVQQANPQGSAGPCCAPRKMSSISMLYFDADYNIIYGMLPGMVVDRCGCS